MPPIQLGVLSALAAWSFAGDYVHGICWMNRYVGVSTTDQSDERQVSEFAAFVERGGYIHVEATALDLLYEQP